MLASLIRHISTNRLITEGSFSSSLKISQQYTIRTIFGLTYACAFSVTTETMDQYLRRVLGIESRLAQALDVIDEQPMRHRGASGAAVDAKLKLKQIHQ